MPKGIYHRKTKAKGPQAVGPHLPKRLRILPEDNASRPMQQCDRLRARLTVAACAERSERAEAERNTIWYNRKYTVCEGCPIGQANAQVERERKVEASSQGDIVCDYCRDKGSYFIDGERFDCECQAHEDEVAE